MSEATPAAAYVKHTAADLGFALCGITEARPSDLAINLHSIL